MSPKDDQGTMVAMSLIQEYKAKEDVSMSKIKYDPQSNSFQETEGWRSWESTTALVDYLIALIAIGWQLILFAIVFAFLAIPIGLVVVGILALFGLI